MPGRFDPKKELSGMREHMSKMWGDAFGSGHHHHHAGPIQVAVDIYETAETVVIVAGPLFGLKPETLDISISEGQIALSGETVSPLDEQDIEYLRRERKFGAFSRTISLSGKLDMEATKAQLKDGVLSISIPKLPEPTPRVIKVTPIA